MAGIYIHVPFCRQACHYCNFHFSTQTSYIDEFIEAIINEIRLRSNYLDEEIKTLYLGGGTPSLLNKAQLENIFNSLHKHFNLSHLVEITTEANPDDLNEAKLSDLKSAGFNRLSIGVQSFFDKHLQMMNRSHDSTQSVSSVKRAQQAGFNNISIDLIYGLPDLSLGEWEENMDKAASLNIQHLSCYSLTIEERTALAALIKKGKITVPGDDVSAEQMKLLMQWAAANGFEHYEISNFAKEGFQSKHNSSYWLNTPYIGLGPSAHSYNGTSRQWNISNNQQYIKALNENNLLFEKEELTTAQRYNEYVMTHLRMGKGINSAEIKTLFGDDYYHYFITEMQPLLLGGGVEVRGDIYVLNNEGKMMADALSAELFWVSPT